MITPEKLYEKSIQQQVTHRKPYDAISQDRKWQFEAYSEWANQIIAETPIDMVLICPNCGTQHIDQPQPEKNWDNPPHRSHECHHCDWVWRPADVPTNGVEKIQTKGKVDSEIYRIFGG
jgi:hypothetical protein